MAKDKVFYWNDNTMSLSIKGKDLVESDPIPEEWIKEQAEAEKKGFKNKFKEYCETQQISDKPKVKFEEKKQRELEDSKKAIDKLRVRNGELVKEKAELDKKVSDYKASFDDLEKLDSIKEELEALKLEKAEWVKIKSDKKELEALVKAVK